MAPECPECGQACYCDGDDTWIELWAIGGTCSHECDPQDLGDDFNLYDEDER